MRLCAGGILVRGHEILLAKRSSDRAFYPGVWDIVGGHFEADELLADALTRELHEELGIRPLAFAEVDVLSEPQPDKYGEARYHIFAVTAWSWNGYHLTVACPCGVTFERWITPCDAELDLLRGAGLN